MILTKNDILLVQPNYKNLLDNDFTSRHMVSMDTKMSLKVKSFHMVLYKGVILTKDNLIKQRWQDSKK
jgi:hypothetical protein